MTEQLRDPELDRLIQQLNSTSGGRAATAEADDAFDHQERFERVERAGDAGDVGDTGGEDDDHDRFGGGASGPLAASLPVAGGPQVGAPPALLTMPRRTPAAKAVSAGAAGAGEPLDEPLGRGGAAANAAGEALGRLLGESARRGASDVLLMPGLPAVFRIDGRLKRADGDPLSGDDIARLFRPQLGGRVRREIEERGYSDFSLHLPGAAPAGGGAAAEFAGEAARTAGAWRFRVNLHSQRGELAAALRALPHEIPTLAGLNLPASFAELVKQSRGLVLVCGPTGSGKSSTLAALIGEINRTRTVHVITIEDPVEYEHRSNKSIIEHVEVGRDARTFSEALRAAVRQDPDVILVGEMRDLETMATAVTAAETGHLVLATLHSNDAVQAVHRIVDVFPPVQQAQIRQQLALSLTAVVAQQLVPRADGRGRIPAVELMLATFPIRHHIRSDKLEKLYNEITLGKRQGMTSFEESLAQLVRAGKIDLEEARVRASHPEELDTRLRG